MKKIRKGRTIQFRWKVKTNGQEVSLEGRNLTAEIVGPEMFVANLDFEIDSEDPTILIATWQGTDVAIPGKYRFVLWENKGTTNQSVVDTNAVIIVESTSEEN